MLGVIILAYIKFREWYMFKLFKNIDKKDIPFVFFNIILVAANVFLELQIPDYMTQITTIIGSSGIVSEIVVVGLKMLLCAILSALCSIVVGYFAARISAGFGYKLRGRVYNHVQAFSFGEINKFSTASLITRTTNDITQVQSVLTMGLQVAIKAPIMATWAIAKIVSKSWQWSLATACAILMITVVMLIIIFVAIPRFKKVQLLNDDLNRVSRENLTGVRVVRAFNAEKYQQDKFDDTNSEMVGNQLFINKVMSLIDPTMNFIMSALPLSIYFIGALLIGSQVLFAGKLEVFSNMVVFSSYAIQVVMSFIMLIMIFMNLPRASVSANRINEVLKTFPAITDGPGVAETKEKGVVEFKNVSFKYPDAEEYVLKDVSFVANKGDRIAFIGSTGSGKSTLINLVPRFYDVTDGEVLIDGVNVKDYKIEELNNKIGFISQRPTLFTGTVKSNLTMGMVKGQKTNDENMDRAINISQSHFINEMFDGVEHKVHQGGKNFSGGQKQRLTIAMAVARNPEILIFDDSFSALDYKTDRAVRAALKEELSETTCLIVAQRIGTIKDADRIIVLDSGNVVGDGTHKELLKSCAVYQEIALSQLSKEELDNA